MKAVYALSAAVVLFYVVTGQDLTCNDPVGRWDQCAGTRIDSGTINPCRNPNDHCVQENPGFSQCRPIARDIPSGWDGAILTCDTACNPRHRSASLSGLSAFLRADNSDISLYNFDFGALDYQDITCPEACQDNPDCVAYDETVDGDCVLFGEDLFTLAGDLIPFFDSQLRLTKCFLPPPLCDPATDEVRLISPTTAEGGGPHQMDSNTDYRTFYAAPVDYALTAAITACRLQQSRRGGCIGFALEDGTVTMLYRPSDGTVDFVADPDVSLQVYSITGCL